MSTRKRPWKLEQENDEYIDFGAHIPDCNGVGAKLRLSYDKARKQIGREA